MNAALLLLKIEFWHSIVDPKFRNFQVKAWIKPIFSTDPWKRSISAAVFCSPARKVLFSKQLSTWHKVICWKYHCTYTSQMAPKLPAVSKIKAAKLNEEGITLQFEDWVRNAHISNIVALHSYLNSYNLKVDPLSDKGFFEGRITQQRRLLASQMADNGHHLHPALAFFNSSRLSALEFTPSTLFLLTTRPGVESTTVTYQTNRCRLNHLHFNPLIIPIALAQ